MKEAIIKEIRKDDSKQAKPGEKKMPMQPVKKKRNRINKEKVDVNNVATSNFLLRDPILQTGKGSGNHNGNNMGSKARDNNNNNQKE